MTKDLLAQRTISIYLYVLVGLAASTAISPLIVFSVPLLALLGPFAFVWWRRRMDRASLGRPFRLPLAAVAAVLVLAPLSAVVWGVADGYSGVELVVLAGIALAFCPFLGAATRFVREQASASSSS